jgi:hypothetical protein
LVFVDELAANFMNATIACLYDTAGLPPQDLFREVKTQAPAHYSIFLHNWLYSLPNGRGGQIASRYMEGLSRTYLKRLSRKKRKAVLSQGKSKRNNDKYKDLQKGLIMISHQYTLFLKVMAEHSDIFSTPEKLGTLPREVISLLKKWLKRYLTDLKTQFLRIPEEDFTLSLKKEGYDKVLSCKTIACLLGRNPEKVLKSVSAFEIFSGYYEFLEAGLCKEISQDEVKNIERGDLSCCSSEAPETSLGVYSIKNEGNEESATFTLPLKLPEKLYEFISHLIGSTKDIGSVKRLNAQDSINLQKKRAILGVYRDVTGALTDGLLSTVNRSCRTKSTQLYTHLKEKRLLNSSFQLNNQELRTLFQDSSNLGDISTNLVQDTYKGHWKHLGSKFLLIRDTFLETPFIEFAPYLFSGFITASLKRTLPLRLSWKSSHVRGQLRGMRRLMEGAKNYPPFLKLTHRYSFTEQECEIISGILGKFQAHHLLHLLLTANVAKAPLLGIYPKKFHKRPNLDTNTINRVLTRLTTLFTENRGLMTGLVKAHISHRTAIENHTEIEAVLKEYETHQVNYIAFLEDNGYSSVYATAELTIIKILLEELHRGTCLLQEYLTCGIFPSEKIVKGLAKLIAPYMRTGSGNKNRS